MRERRDFPGAACLRSTEGEHVYPGTTNINGLTLFLDQVPRLYFGAKPDHPQPSSKLAKANGDRNRRAVSCQACDARDPRELVSWDLGAP